MLISCVLQCTDGLRLIKRLENYAYRMSEKTAYRSLEKSAYRSLKKLLTVHLQIHLTACIVLSPSLLGGLLSDPRLQGQLVFTYGEVPDPSDLPLLCL